MPARFEDVYKVEGMSAEAIAGVLKSTESEISGLKSRVTTAESKLIEEESNRNKAINHMVLQEENARVLKDEELEKAINIEKNAREEQDAELKEYIDDCILVEENLRQRADSAEQKAREAKDAELEAKLAEHDADIEALKTSGGSGDLSSVISKSLYYYGDENIIPTDESYFNITEDGIISINEATWDNTITSIIIPYEINGITVNNTSTGIFSECSQITSVIIPRSITFINSEAFSDCINLRSIGIPTSVTAIGEYAFYNCTGLTSINIPDSVTSIGDFAFYNCTKLTSINIPDSVTSIGDSAFYGCNQLSSVTFKGSESQWNSISIKSANEPLLNANITYEGNLATEEYVDEKCGSGGGADLSNVVDKLLYYYGDSTIIPTDESYFNITEDGAISRNPDVWDDFVVTDVVIPYEVNGIKVTKIADRGFGRLEDSSPPILTNVIMPNTITSIGNYAFVFCYLLDNVVIPDGVTYIGYDAFYNCNNLHHTVIPKSVNYLGLSAFEDTGLYTVTYKGSKSQWDNIEISEGNEPLLNSNITFEGNLATEPTVEVNNIDTQIIYNFSEKNNTDTRIIANSLISISFYLDADISDDSNHISSLSFDTSDTAPNIDYPGGGVINWIGTGCSISEGQSVFIPEPNKTYDIVFYYNGRHMVGMVNGYTPVVSKTTNEVSA